MNYDSNVQLPEIAVTVANVAEHLRNHRLTGDQSLFLENFPIEHLSVLNSAIIAGYNVGIYTKADPVFGGAGVRIFSIASEKIEQRNGSDVVKEFKSYSDADYEVSAKGVNTTFEDAPLVAWLAHNAAKQYNKPKYDLDDL